MNKLAIQETFPPGIVGREIVLAQMCHHYRRISTAKARVDTNLFKPPKLSLSRPLSAEVASIVQRCMSPRSPPKHRRCLKYEHETDEHHIKLSSRSQAAESRLRLTPEVYHPAVKPPKTASHDIEGLQQATQTSLDNSFAEDPIPKTKDEAVQTTCPGYYRPLDARSVQFLRDITTEALQRRAFTSSALNRIFLDHQYRNTYSLTQELMERELEELRRQLGMLPKYNPNGSTVSDGEALDALDTLVLDPKIKEQVIHSLRLSRNNDVKRPTYSYFDRLRDDVYDDQLPTRDRTNLVLNKILESTAQNNSTGGQQEIQLKNKVNDVAVVQIPEGGLDAVVEEDDREVTTASSSKTEDDEEEEVESASESNDEADDQSTSGSSIDEVPSESENEDEITQKESTTSRPAADDQSDRQQPPESVQLKQQIEDRDQLRQNLQTMKLELQTEDKWKSSLDVVKEESDSTSGQISDISMASTPTEIDSKQEKVVSLSKQGASTSTYFSAGSAKPSNSANETVENDEEKKTLASQTNGTTSSGGAIVRQQGDSEKSEAMVTAESSESLGQIVKHMSDLSDVQGAVDVSEKRNEDAESIQEGGDASETGSEVETESSESEDDVGSEISNSE